MWLYHNQNHIEKSAYERGMQDAAVAAELAKLKAANAKIDPDYVDPEFKEDPSLMYDDEYVQAAYNPKVVETPEKKSSFLWTVVWYTFILGAIGGVVWLVFIKKWEQTPDSQDD